MLANADPGDVIVLHDGGGRGERTADALREILPELTARGLEVVTLSEMFSDEAGGVERQ